VKDQTLLDDIMGPRERDSDVKMKTKPIHALREGDGEEGGTNQSKNRGRRGEKRRHGDTECTDSCDCEEFGHPLAKRINNLNLQFNQTPALHTNGSLPGSDKASQSGSNLKEATTEQSPGGDPREAGQFLQRYPFPSEAPYFSSNMLLNTLYEERVRRNPHLKHFPT